MDGRSTIEARTRVSQQNAILKRKFPVGFDCRSRLYRCWRAMHLRCYQPSHGAYQRYGGRGIGVCHEWHDYSAFMSWAITAGYSDNLTIDRINNDGGYCSENCRWVTLRDQQRNRRSNLPLMTAFGRTQSLMEWAVEFGVPYHRLHRRVISGRDLEWSLTTPANAQRRRKPMSQETKDKIGRRARERYAAAS